jgi:hypothetical protein
MKRQFGEIPSNVVRLSHSAYAIGAMVSSRNPMTHGAVNR